MLPSSRNNVLTSTSPYAQAVRHYINDLDITSDTLLCIPQPSSLMTDVVTLQDLQSHCLKPTGIAPGEYRNSALGAAAAIVNVSGSFITTNKSSKCRIIWTEKVELTANDRCTVAHINRPLVGGVPVHVPHNAAEMDTPTLQRYLALMKAYPENEIVFHTLDEELTSVRRNMTTKTLSLVEQSLKSLWVWGVSSIAASGTFAEASNDGNENSQHLQISQVVESYILAQITTTYLIPQIVGPTMQERNEAFLSACKRMQHYSPAEFGIRQELQTEQREAINVLATLPLKETPLEMLLVLKHVIDCISDELNRIAKSKSFQMTTDDLLDQLLYVILKSSSEKNIVFSIAVYLEYISHFHFLNSNTTVLGYSLANFQVATEWFIERDDAITPTSSIERANMLNTISNRKTISSTRTTESNSCVKERVIEIIGLRQQKEESSNAAQELALDEIDDGAVVQICCSRRYFAFLTESGRVYTWGSATGGRLGHSETLKYVNDPEMIASLSQHKITHIACGDFHMLAADLNGYSYAWGSTSRHYGTLGITKESSVSPVLIAATPVVIQNLRGNYVTSVSCGARHSLALTSSGEVFSWGCPRGGKLGRKCSDIIPHFLPGLVATDWVGKSLSGIARDDEHTTGSAAATITCGSQHSVVLSRDGAVFTWGSGGEGRLGHASHMDVTIPQQVLSLSNPAIRIVQSAAGAAHTLFLSRTGRVFGCGDNRFGQLSSSSSNDNDKCVFVPRIINVIAANDDEEQSILQDMAQISCGENHSAAQDVFGKVFTWGSNMQLQCGGGDESSTQVQSLPRFYKCKKLACGASHTMAIW